MKSECDCKTFIIINVVQHQPECAIWEADTCDYCGGQYSDQNPVAGEVKYRGEKIEVCEGCYQNHFTV